MHSVYIRIHQERYINGIRQLFRVLQDSTVASGVASAAAAPSGSVCYSSTASLGHTPSASRHDLRQEGGGRGGRAGGVFGKDGSLTSRSHLFTSRSHVSTGSSSCMGKSVLYKSLKYDRCGLVFVVCRSLLIASG